MIPHSNPREFHIFRHILCQTKVPCRFKKWNLIKHKSTILRFREIFSFLGCLPLWLNWIIYFNKLEDWFWNRIRFWIELTSKLVISWFRINAKQGSSGKVGPLKGKGPSTTIQKFAMHHVFSLARHFSHYCVIAKIYDFLIFWIIFIY